MATEVEPPRSGDSPNPSVQVVPCHVGDVVALLGETRVSAVAGRYVGVLHEREPGEDGSERGSCSRVVHMAEALLRGRAHGQRLRGGSVVPEPPTAQVEPAGTPKSGRSTSAPAVWLCSATLETAWHAVYTRPLLLLLAVTGSAV